MPDRAAGERKSPASLSIEDALRLADLPMPTAVRKLPRKRT